MKNIRGIVRGKVEFDEIAHLIDEPIILFKLDEEVEVISGPFKGCRAKIFDDDGKTVTIELLEWERFARINISRDFVRKRR